MQKPARSRFLWLLIPPAMGLAVYFGPLGGTETTAATRTPAPATNPGAPQIPDLWQMASALVGVLLVGVLVVTLIAKLRNPPTRSRGSSPRDLLALRQSLRISPRHRVHAIEFNDRVLLLGECDGNLALLSSTDDPAGQDDELLLANRGEFDGGADLRDTPRARKQAKVKSLATAQNIVSPAPTAAKTTAGRADVAAANLADFKTLLRRARKQASV
ncbi:MAG: flagellar biosynthetic protein FliO [Planctomycetes bacterium]|nr:flagellar biosynthetic protein FliO [Planctomycetota bacterium]MCB9872010.1 flagellar biosynthetic protein FliO [Planctomycetota bacterium]MCB9888414.1 flagellar biosynthetic protein FliO [Planctomycetota bacterium]